MAADKNKFSTVPSPEVTKSDSPSVIAFSDIQIDKKGGNSYFKQAADCSKSKKFFVSESFEVDMIISKLSFMVPLFFIFNSRGNER